MLKKFGYLLIVILIAMAVIQFFGEKDGEGYQEEDRSDQVHSSEEEPSENQNVSPETLVDGIFSESKKGKIPYTPFIAGQTEMQEITKKWSEAEQTTKTENGSYAEYPDHKVTVGYRDQLVFDVRSFDSELQNIHMEDIKKIKGEPDEVRYYKDETTDQIILVYLVNDMYELKWILPKPTDREPNPKVHHVSVFTEPKVDKNSDIIADMSLNEKIGQMIFAGISETSLTSNTRDLLNNYYVGGIIFYSNNLETSQQTVRLLNEIKSENAPNRLPLLLGVDQEGGKVSRLPGDLIDTPTNGKVGTINDAQFSYEIGTLLGKELNAFGFNLDFAPVLDVNSNPNNPIIGDRSFGNNADIVSELGIKTMEGIQSQNVVSVIKHFPGHGDTSVDSHLDLPKVNKSMEELEELELIPFERAVNNGADVVMVAHILLPKLDATFPSSMSENIITGILRKQLDFTGVVMTDDMTMKAITNNYDIGQAAVESVKAGSDIIMVAHDYNKVVSTIDALKTAVENGEISEERINESVSRIIQLKQKYDLANKKVQEVNIEELNQYGEKILNKYMD
jgi:beta-N-acetylhexosaminidase